MTASDHSGFSTRAIHVGSNPDPNTGAVVTPISLATTFVQDSVGNHRGYEYSRTNNPTRDAVQRTLASLEGADFGFCFASGLAASDTLFRLLSPGDHIIAPIDAYGGTHRLLSKVVANSGVEVTPVDQADLDAVKQAWRDTTRMVWIESPTNPMLGISDIAALAELTKTTDALCAVDNTFATPYLQQPLTLGADVVVHSTTKYLGGHSDVVGGFVATNDERLAERVAFLQNSVGAVPSPFDCYMLQRGVKTLAVRMERHCENARAVVEALSSHSAVDRVLYPGLGTHPGHEIAARQMRDFGGMVSFTLADGESAALEVVTKTKIFALAESLGAVESLIEHPGQMTHLSVAGSAMEVPSSLVRLSVGIEDAEDLVDDLTQALNALN